MLIGATKIVRATRDRLRLRKTFLKFRDFSMVPEDIYIGNLHLASTIKTTPGNIVECGTWRGGMIAGLADILGPSRHYHLFDSFEGLPPAREIDGEAALAWQKNTSGPTYYNNCQASADEARKAMAMSVARDYTIVKGWFSESLPNACTGPIALLRLDADWHDSTKAILEHLADKVVPKGLIIVDDYYVFEGCTRVFNEFAATRGWMIRQYPIGGVCYVIV